MTGVVAGGGVVGMTGRSDGSGPGGWHNAPGFQGHLLMQTIFEEGGRNCLCTGGGSHLQFRCGRRRKASLRTVKRFHHQRRLCNHRRLGGLSLCELLLVLRQKKTRMGPAASAGVSAAVAASVASASASATSTVTAADAAAASAPAVWQLQPWLRPPTPQPMPSPVPLAWYGSRGACGGAGATELASSPWPLAVRARGQGRRMHLLAMGSGLAASDDQAYWSYALCAAGHVRGLLRQANLRFRRRAWKSTLKW